MRRYWVLGLLSVLMRLIGALCLIISLFAITTLSANELGLIKIPTTANNSAELMSLSLTILSYNFWATFGIFIAMGWYGMGQFLVLMIDIESNTRRVANRADDAQRRRLNIPPASPEDERFWDEQINNNNPSPRPNQPRPMSARMPPEPPVRGVSVARITYAQDDPPKERVRRRISIDTPMPIIPAQSQADSARPKPRGETQAYGRPAKPSE